MRINDWSSDVCYSDLPSSFRSWSAQRLVSTVSHNPSGASPPSGRRIIGVVIRWPTLRTNITLRPCSVKGAPSGAVQSRRSEEHTSELQSLMRISYAVFCLKKKKKDKHSTESH